ncbi:MAG: transglutaminase-like domain-containing protein, partial [Chloroflexota bacterium]
VSRNVEIFLLSINANTKDPIAVFVTTPMQSGEYYQIHSLVGIPTITDLRQSGNEYPQWLLQYLQLPEDFSADIQQLALDITAELDNPYDKAYAITKYLRENIEYSETFPALPQWKDPLESFLFTYKSGFCNYYASAEVLMLRSLGIPARFAVGYAQGEFNKSEGLYTVRQKDSHAWPEVYFNDYGWVEFEPTTAQPVRMLPLGISSSTPAIPISHLPSIEEEEVFNDLPEAETVPVKVFSPQITPDKPLTLILVWLGPFVLSPVFALIVWWIATPLVKLRPLSRLVVDGFDRRGWEIPNWLQRLNQSREHLLFEKSYGSLAKAIKRLGYPVDPTDTPAQRGLVLSKMLPEISPQVDILVREYELARFSTHDANLLAANQSSQYILRTVRRNSLRLRLKHRFKKHSQ